MLKDYPIEINRVDENTVTLTNHKTEETTVIPKSEAVSELIEIAEITFNEWVTGDADYEAYVEEGGEDDIDAYMASKETDEDRASVMRDYEECRLEMINEFLGLRDWEDSVKQVRGEFSKVF